MNYHFMLSRFINYYGDIPNLADQRVPYPNSALQILQPSQRIFLASLILCASSSAVEI